MDETTEVQIDTKGCQDIVVQINQVVDEIKVEHLEQVKDVQEEMGREIIAVQEKYSKEVEAWEVRCKELESEIKGLSEKVKPQ